MLVVERSEGKAKAVGPLSRGYGCLAFESRSWLAEIDDSGRGRLLGTLQAMLLVKPRSGKVLAF